MYMYVLKLYSQSHYPENAADSDTGCFHFFQLKFPFGDIAVHLARCFFVPSPVINIEVGHSFCIDKARKRGCIEHRVVNNNFRNALTLHYNFGGYFTSSINLFYEQ